LKKVTVIKTSTTTSLILNTLHVYVGLIRIIEERSVIRRTVLAEVIPTTIKVTRFGRTRCTSNRAIEKKTK